MVLRFLPAARGLVAIAACVAGTGVAAAPADTALADVATIPDVRAPATAAVVRDVAREDASTERRASERGSAAWAPRKSPSAALVSVAAVYACMASRNCADYRVSAASLCASAPPSVQQNCRPRPD